MPWWLSPSRGTRRGHAAADWYSETIGYPFSVHGFVIRHPAGPLVADAGIGSGNSVIDEMYAPATVDVVRIVATAGSDHVRALVLTHLHFDHCGRARRFDAPTYVQCAEMDAAQTSRYTVPEWILDGAVQLVDGDLVWTWPMAPAC